MTKHIELLEISKLSLDHALEGAADQKNTETMAN